MELYYKVVTYVLAGLLGVCVGSFLNVVIYRVPNGMSLAKPASHCPKCDYVLRWYDNIPVLSYILLGGKCRNCKAHISFRYTLVELWNMLLWLLCVFLFWENSIPLAVIYAISSSVLICVFFIDLEHKLIFDRFQIILLVLGVVATIFDKEYGYLSHIIGGIAGFAVLFLISFLYEKIRKTEGLGGGDVKLVGVAGLLLGWQKLFLSLLIATVLASVIMVTVNLVRSKSQKASDIEEDDGENAPEEAEKAEEDTDKSNDESKQFPFAPFLVTGFFVAMFFGSQIINWYLALLGL